MARPRSKPYLTYNMIVFVEQLQALRLIAHRRRVSVACIMREIIDKFLTEEKCSD